MIYTVSKKFIFFLFVFSLITFAYAASNNKPDLVFDSSQTNFNKTSYQADTYNISFLVKNKGQGIVFKNSSSYFNVKCTDKNGKIVKEKKYKGQMKDIKKESFTLNKNKFPVTCKIDGENKIAETNENNNSYTMKDTSANSNNTNNNNINNDSNNTNSNKPDLVLSSVSLDPNYPTPKVNDENMYVKFTVKNLGKSIKFSSTTKGVFSCLANNVQILSKEIKLGTLDKNGTLTIDGIRNVPTPSMYLFIQTGNFISNCQIILISSNISESNINNNYKTLSFSIGNSNQTLSNGTIKASDFDQVSSIADEGTMVWSDFTMPSKYGYRVMKNGKYGYINKDKKLTINLDYDDISVYSIRGNNIILKVKKEKIPGSYSYDMGLINSEGMIILQVENSKIFENGGGFYISDYASFVKNNGFAGLIDGYGNIIVPATTYQDVRPIEDGYPVDAADKTRFLVSLDGKRGLIDNNLNIILTPQYYDYRILSINKLIAFRGTHKRGLYNFDGDEILPIQYDSITRDCINTNNDTQCNIRIRNFDPSFDKKMDLNGNWINQ